MFSASLSGGTPQIKIGLGSTTLVKATLVPWEREVPPIQFMFNPTEITFNCSVAIKESEGARTEKTGQPKNNFSHLQSEKVTISKILFDTYEERINVVEKYIEPFRAAVEFIGKHRSSLAKGLPGPLQDLADSQNMISTNPIEAVTTLVLGTPKRNERTPHYRFVWGSQVFLRRCAVENLTYKLTLFLPDGTPVRAIIDSLSLKAVDEDEDNRDLMKTAANRIQDSMAVRLKGSASFRTQ